MKKKVTVAVRYTAHNLYYTRAFGLLLPPGNAAEFPNIRKHLSRLRVVFEEMPTRGGGRYFVFPETERRKLPSYKGNRFVPSSDDGEAGHGFYHVTVFQIAGVV